MSGTYTKEHVHVVFFGDGRESAVGAAVQEASSGVPIERVHAVIPNGAPQESTAFSNLPHENLIVEPNPRGKSAAIALAGCHLYRREPNALMVCVDVDASKQVAAILRENLGEIIAAADLPGSLVSVGKPTFDASCGGGVMVCGEALPSGPNTFHGVKYCISAAAAKRPHEGNSLQPVRINAWSLYSLMEAYRNYCPVDFQIINEMARTWNRDRDQTAELYGKLSSGEVENLLLSKVQSGFSNRNVFVRAELTNATPFAEGVSGDVLVMSPPSDIVH